MARRRSANAETQESQRIYREVQKQAKSMEDEYLVCRAGGHAFTVPLTARKVRGGYEESFACRNECGVKRSRVLDAYGLIVQSNMDYSGAKGYLLVGTGRLTGYGKGALRVENITRVIERLGA